jgi:mannose-6-phosphate isomerase-like protein (cupin superfamily)
MPKRRDLFKFTAWNAVMAAFANERLPNATRSAGQGQVTHEPFGDLTVYFDGPTGQLASLTAGSLRLKPGMEPHPPHQHPEEEIMLVTEGTGEISIDGKITKVASGSMMFCGAGTLHGIKNTGKTPLLFYYYKWKR